MFGRQPKSSDFEHQLAFDATSYQGHLQAKPAGLRDLVKTNLAEVATNQKTTYDKRSTSRISKLGDLVWLSVGLDTICFFLPIMLCFNTYSSNLYTSF